MISSPETAPHLLTFEGSDERYLNRPLPGIRVVRVHAKVLSGYQEPANDWQVIFQNAISQDNLWITAEEEQDLVSGTFPQSLGTRIARYHLIDNTRGEPSYWKKDEVRSSDWKWSKDGELRGSCICNAVTTAVAIESVCLGRSRRKRFLEPVRCGGQRHLLGPQPIHWACSG